MKRLRPEYPMHKGPVIVVLFFLVLLGTGVAFGEPERVLEQAVRICLSCIGIG
ncbi:MAG: hypothetical protein KJ950_06200 [Proteobacteria bacterium]|nr:hypothetical protein [Pseudomonadota bacterium]MBU1688777.1 hypothetical protein [Pseudomonadota bacterium]